MVNVNNNIIKSELLCFIQNSFDRLSKDTLLSTVVSFYTVEEIAEGKQCLYAQTDKLDIPNDISIPDIIQRKDGKSKKKATTKHRKKKAKWIAQA